MAFFVRRFHAGWSRLPRCGIGLARGLLVLSIWLLCGLAGCASPSGIERVERRLGEIERRLERLAAAESAPAPLPARPATPPADPVEVEVARLRADIDDIRLLLLDLQMKAGR